MNKEKPKCVVKAETFQGLNIYVPEDKEKKATLEVAMEVKNDQEPTASSTGKVKKMGLD